MDDKQKNLTIALDSLEKIFGKGTIGTFDKVGVVDRGAYSTGSLQLDSYCKGGFPKGKFSEIYGPEGSGKTTLCLHAIADCQSKGEIACFLDVEGTFDPEYARALGVDTSKLIFSSPDTGEEALEKAEKIMRSGSVDIVVIDSVATLLPESEQEKDYGSATMGLQARLMSQACRKLLPVVKKNNVALIWINQLRDTIGGYGPTEKPTGGNSLKFYAALRLDIRRDGAPIKDKDGIVIAEPRRVKIVKTKLTADSNLVVRFDIKYGEGIDQAGEILDLAESHKIVDKSGSWYSYSGAKIAQGRENAKQFLKDNPEVLEEIRLKLLK